MGVAEPVTGNNAGVICGIAWRFRAGVAGLIAIDKQDLVN
jgi:hypothetical protein